MEIIRAADFQANFGKPSRKNRAHPEDDLQRTCINFSKNLENKYPVLRFLFHAANGGKRPYGEAGKMKALGVRQGVPDLLLPMASPTKIWKGLALELKSKTGVVSPAQFDWLYAFSIEGWLTGIVWSADDFVDYLTIFLGTNKSF